MNAENKVNGLIEGRAPFLVVRSGNMEAWAVYQDRITPELQTNTGFYCKPTSKRNDVFNNWKNRYIEAHKQADLIMVVPSQIMMCRAMFLKTGIPLQKCYPSIEFAALVRIFSQLSRTKQKILIINSKTELMKTRIFKFKQIFPGFDFDDEFHNRLTFIKSFDTYPGNELHDSWLDTFNVICRQIDDSEFDIALLGCGCYGLPLCDYIYTKMHKSAFYVGGVIQLLFGILGKRWFSKEKERSFFNEHWINVPAEYRPVNYEKIEGGCYW